MWVIFVTFSHESQRSVRPDGLYHPWGAGRKSSGEKFDTICQLAVLGKSEEPALTGKHGRVQQYRAKME